MSQHRIDRLPLKKPDHRPFCSPPQVLSAAEADKAAALYSALRHGGTMLSARAAAISFSTSNLRPLFSVVSDRKQQRQRRAEFFSSRLRSSPEASVRDDA